MGRMLISQSPSFKLSVYNRRMPWQNYSGSCSFPIFRTFSLLLFQITLKIEDCVKRVKFTSIFLYLFLRVEGKGMQFFFPKMIWDLLFLDIILRSQGGHHPLFLRWQIMGKGLMYAFQIQVGYVHMIFSFAWVEKLKRHEGTA